MCARIHNAQEGFRCSPHSLSHPDVSRTMQSLFTRKSSKKMAKVAEAPIKPEKMLMSSERTPEEMLEVLPYARTPSQLHWLAMPHTTHHY